MDQFTLAYITCALWSNTMDKKYSMNDLAPETMEQMKEDCQSFQEKYGSLIQNDLSQAGHDFWLTRNGHGAGFWDGDWEKDLGEILTKASKTYGECNLFVCDDGLIDCYPTN